MPRPSFSTIDAFNSGWVSRLNANFTKVLGAPFPITISTSLTQLAIDYDPKLYQDCLAVITDEDVLCISDGTSWDRYMKQIPYQADSTASTISDAKDDLNTLLTSLRTYGWMDPS
jgi:hypothetical protein